MSEDLFQVIVETKEKNKPENTYKFEKNYNRKHPFSHININILLGSFYTTFNACTNIYHFFKGGCVPACTGMEFLFSPFAVHPEQLSVFVLRSVPSLQLVTEDGEGCSIMGSQGSRPRPVTYVSSLCLSFFITKIRI